VTSTAVPRFWWWLVTITVAGFVGRVVYVVCTDGAYVMRGDPLYYHQQANFLADGLGFVRTQSYGALRGTNVSRNSDLLLPTAFHPPLYPMMLSVPSWFGLTTWLWHRIASCLIGAATIPVVALVSRRLAGDRAGLIGAVLATVSPALWLSDAPLLSEGLFGLMIALTILAAYRFRDQPSRARVVLLGAAIGLAALTRGEALLLGLLLVVPLVLSTREAWPRRVGLLAICGVTVLLVLAPWVVRSMTQFREPVLIASNGDAVLAFANCDATYHGSKLGSWYLRCPDRFPRGDEGEVARAYREMGTEYMRDHLDRLPVVVAARLGRILEVYQPLQNARNSGHPHWAAYTGLGLYLLLVPLAIYGGIVVRRRGETLIPLMSPVVMVLVVAAATYGRVRFRMPTEIVLVILAGVGTSVRLDRSRTRSRAVEGVTAPN
jgi:4-amino-4-deoxy-L-arabinose transferase-like glycosyltransferase